MDENILTPYIRLATYSTLTAPRVIGTRSIFDYELIFAQSGGCTINFEGTNYAIKKNNAVLIPPRVEHSFTVVGENFVQPHIHFDAVYTKKSRETPISFKKIADMTDYERDLFQNDVLADVHIPYLFTPQDISTFSKAFFSVIDLYTAGERGVLLKAHMLILLDMVISQFERTNPLDVRLNDERIFAIKDYIDSNFMQIITLDGLSEQFSMNKFTMLRKFKAAYGESIISYYNSLRAKNAAKKLLETAMPVKQIGASLSFSDEYTFSRFFKSVTGQSPLNYRKSGGKPI